MATTNETMSFSRMVFSEREEFNDQFDNIANWFTESSVRVWCWSVLVKLLDHALICLNFSVYNFIDSFHVA
jgi:hypothetical protein